MVLDDVSLMSDDDLVYAIQSGVNENDCLKELINRHSAIFIECVKKYTSDSVDPITRRDLIDSRSHYIFDACLKFDESKNCKFSTFLYNHAKWICLNIYNRSKKRFEQSIEESPIELASGSCSIESQVEESDAIESILSECDKIDDSRVLKIFKMRYFETNGKSTTPWKDIAKELNLSIQGCLNIHNKHLPFLSSKLKTK